MANLNSSSFYGLGVNLTQGAPISTWVKEAGFDWMIKETNVRYNCDGELKIFPSKTALYRSDNGNALSIVSMDYKVVQPAQVMEFFSDLVGMGEMSLTSAGVMFGGCRFFAMADTGNTAKTRSNDQIKGNLLLITSCDGTLATNAMFVATNVRNQSTLRIALRGDSKNRVRVTHARTFDPTDIKDKLGLIDRAWEDFIGGVSELDNVKVNKRKARDFLYDLIANPKLSVEDQPYTVAAKIDAIMQSHTDESSAWDLVQSVCDNVDNTAGRSRVADRKLWNTWYGKEADLKENAFIKAQETFNV